MYSFGMYVYRDMGPQHELQTGQDLVLMLLFFYQNIQFDSRKNFRVVENICMTEKKQFSHKTKKKRRRNIARNK